MKKILALILAFVMVFALAGIASADDDLGDTVVLYSSMTEFDLEALITCFNEVYPDIEVEVVSGSVGEYTSRIAAEADNPQGDVTWGGLCDSDGYTPSRTDIRVSSTLAVFSTPERFSVSILRAADNLKPRTFTRL